MIRVVRHLPIFLAVGSIEELLIYPLTGVLLDSLELERVRAFKKDVGVNVTLGRMSF